MVRTKNLVIMNVFTINQLLTLMILHKHLVHPDQILQLTQYDQLYTQLVKHLLIHLQLMSHSHSQYKKTIDNYAIYYKDNKWLHRINNKQFRLSNMVSVLKINKTSFFHLKLKTLRKLDV